MEAQVATDMSTVFKEPESTNLLLPLLPCDPLGRFSEPSAKVMVAIQVSFFACGGITICACVDHVVADVAATATFLKIWAAVACGANDIDNDLICNRTSVCPSLDLSGFWKQFVDENKDKKVLTKRLLFDGSKIASLRNEIGNGLCSYRLSSSWCRIPFYETDFGWGKPIRTAIALGMERVVFFLDTKDGEGIE
ncbi:Uncharacterized protein TCM_014575 [Theobroma cacao]|uniref:HXXXD-type acyl-transferase family protein n=1 Tax=Theobroma cacao TaxID=3641 RepID=A0A061FZA0_THECC|nr:Uncharacterized protein TCM_014575 [Theobroma cacao]